MNQSTQPGRHTLSSSAPHPFIKWFADIAIGDIPLVGGKNASLGEMVRELTGKGVKVMASISGWKPSGKSKRISQPKPLLRNKN